ncbi:MAG: small subunit ribosomal protein [Patescibacteria group bacterium]|jgi:small subunit ribosomal protein S18|nr:small subunit ribosomal protein [Patescibacteria group bacterium]
MAAKRTQSKPRRKIVAPKKDYFVENKIVPHYSDVSNLQKFVSERGKILPRSRTGLTATTQRKLTKAIKYARHLALMPFVSRD